MIRLAINGYGRIGRSVLRALVEGRHRDSMRVVAVNELADPSTVVHLTRYDTTHGRFPSEVAPCAGGMSIAGDNIRLLSQANIPGLPWSELGVDVVLECTGAFDDRATAEQHLQQGAAGVLFSQPARADVDATVVFGINHALLQREHQVVSAASCTTNGIVPVIQALHAAFGIEAGCDLHSGGDTRDGVKRFTKNTALDIDS